VRGKLSAPEWRIARPDRDSHASLRPSVRAGDPLSLRRTDCPFVGRCGSRDNIRCADLQGRGASHGLLGQAALTTLTVEIVHLVDMCQNVDRLGWGSLISSSGRTVREVGGSSFRPSTQG
jgi:hypothetical protein